VQDSRTHGFIPVSITVSTQRHSLGNKEFLTRLQSLTARTREFNDAGPVNIHGRGQSRRLARCRCPEVRDDVGIVLSKIADTLR